MKRPYLTKAQYRAKVASGEIVPVKWEPPKPWPQTIDELVTKCGPYAELVTKHLKCRLACRWKWGGMKPREQWPFPDLDEDSRKLIWESGSRYEWTLLLDAGADIAPAKTLDIFSDEAWTEAVRTVEETVAQWEAAGSPGLDHEALKSARSQISSWVRNYGLPYFEGSGISKIYEVPTPERLAQMEPNMRDHWQAIIDRATADPSCTVITEPQPSLNAAERFKHRYSPAYLATQTPKRRAFLEQQCAT